MVARRAKRGTACHQYHGCGTEGQCARASALSAAADRGALETIYEEGLHEMNKELQRIKIAEVCGYSKGWDYRSGYPATPWNQWCIKSLPDYLNDLNAMHEAEIHCIIPNGLWDDYVLHLIMIMRDGSRFWGQATAAQRAEAFLKTLNLWEE
jgi:hypothetical protein